MVEKKFYGTDYIFELNKMRGTLKGFLSFSIGDKECEIEIENLNIDNDKSESNSIPTDLKELLKDSNLSVDINYKVLLSYVNSINNIETLKCTLFSSFVNNYNSFDLYLDDDSELCTFKFYESMKGEWSNTNTTNASNSDFETIFNSIRSDKDSNVSNVRNSEFKDTIRILKNFKSRDKDLMNYLDDIKIPSIAIYAKPFYCADSVFFELYISLEEYNRVINLEPVRVLYNNGIEMGGSVISDHSFVISEYF